jgi:hypothetical protein
MNKRIGLVIAGVAAASVLAGGAAYGAVSSIPDSAGVVHGCYDSGGNLKVIDTSVTSSCPKGYTSLNWNQTGPAGSQGVQGPQGVKGPQGVQGPQGTPGNEFTWTDTCQQSADCGDQASATSIPAGTVLTPVAISATGGCADVITNVGVTDRSANHLAVVAIGGTLTTPFVQLDGPDTISAAGPLFMNFDTFGATCDQPVTVTFTFDEALSFS